MSPVYLNPHQSSSIPFLDLKGDQQHNLPTMVDYVHDHVTDTSNNSSYFSGSNFGYHVTTEFIAMDYSRCTHEKVVEKLILSHDHQPIVYPFDHIQDEGDLNVKIMKNKYENPKKCKPTKLKIVQKAALMTEKLKKLAGDNNGNQAQERNDNIYGKIINEANNNNNGIRMCSDCHTTTTPLWRSGPQGPKSLCNACGIRQRKARKAAAAMAASQAPALAQATELATGGSGSSSPMSSSTTLEAPKVTIDEEMSKSKVKLDNDHTIISHTLPLKKRSKTFNNSSWSYNSYNDINTNKDINNFINDNSTKRVFPGDEEEGAVLLMALSSGLARSS